MSAATLTPAGDGSWRLAGVLDFSTVPAVWPAFEKALKQSGSMRVSLAEVERTNSAGLVMLVEAHGLARRGGHHLVLTDLPAELLDLARMSGCEQLVTAEAA